MVMLSPDAHEPLLELQPEQVLCIGGIVDRTVCKGLTAGWAAERGVVARRLPVSVASKHLRASRRCGSRTGLGAWRAQGLRHAT